MRVAFELPPNVRAGPPTLRGREDVGLEGGGAAPRVRPGCEKASEDDSLPQRLPMVMDGSLRTGDVIGSWVRYRVYMAGNEVLLLKIDGNCCFARMRG